MKKIISACILFSLLFSLSACNQAPADQLQSTPAATSGQSDPANQFTREAMAAVSVPATTESAQADDGTVIFNYTHQSMSLTIPDPDVADKVIIDFLNRVDSTQDAAQSILASARSGYTAGSVNWTPYLCSVLYEPMRVDPGVLSLFGMIITYNGSAHPEKACVAANYDLLTGDVLTLASIMAPEIAADNFCRLTLDALASIADESYLYEDYADTVRQRFEQDPSTDEAWFLTETGLCFYFAPYEIAPYASGVITAEIPYSKLTGILYDGYFPAEQAHESGIVAAQRLQDADMERFTQITELIIDKGGEMALLYTDSTVHNVRIDVGTWDNAGKRFTKSYTAFATDTLSSGDAVMVESYLADTLPNLRLSYHSGNRDISVYISQSGKDGDIILLGLE